MIALIYDLTSSRTPLDKLCGARDEDEFMCTRLPNHTGRHAAGDGDYIIAVWGDES